MSLDVLITRWKERRVRYFEDGALVSGEKIAALVIHDLEVLRDAVDGELLSISDAAVRSGYSVEHLRRLVGNGSIPNAGRKGKPKVRVSDLPIRVSRDLPARATRNYDPFTDARDIVGRIGGQHASKKAA